MAEIKKARIFLRRGTDASRLGTDLCEGELGYSTNGKRVFVGDGSTSGGNSLGTTVFLLPAASATHPTADPFTTVETLTAVTSNGRAEIGDMAFVPASSYSLSSFNNDYGLNTTSTPKSTFGTLYVLSARDGGTGALTWVVANSGIPVSHLDIPNDSISGDRIHGGDISGDLTFSDNIKSLSAVTLSGVAASAAEVESLTGSIIYPLGITATSQVTAVSSIYQLGAVTGSAFLGTQNPNDLTLDKNGNKNNIAAAVSSGTYSQPGGGINANWGSITYKKGTIVISDIRTAIGTPANGLLWTEIDEFHFEFFYDNKETQAGFFGYYNEACGRDIALEFDIRSNDKGSMDDRATYNYHIIPNAFTNTEQLQILVGGHDAYSIAKLVGIKRR